MSSTAILACPRCKDADHVCGIEVRGTYDGVLYWSCLQCGHRWHRWPQGHSLRVTAEPLVQGERA